MSTVTTVCYHYVRPIRGSRWPRIRGLELDDFRSQLAYLKRNYTIVSLPDVINALDGGELPDNACLLTFDDGYLDHYQNVFPLLHDAKVSGAFFPIGASVLGRSVANVNKVHWIVAHPLRSVIVEHIKQQHHLMPCESRWDDPETAAIKKALQTYAADCVDPLFGLVAEHEPWLADELYMTAEHVRVMVANGMHFGVHGWQHERFSRMTESQQANDLDNSIRFLRSLNALPERWAMCYPYGAYKDHNEITRRLLRDRGCAIAFTTVKGSGSPLACDPLTLPRLDTNDLPRA